MAAQGSPCGQGGLLASREVDIPHTATHCTHTHTCAKADAQAHTHPAGTLLLHPCCCTPVDNTRLSGRHPPATQAMGRLQC